MNHRYNPDMHYRRSVRLRGYDYTHAGAYYVTIVAQDRVFLFGEVVGENVRLGEAGVMVQAVWEALPHRFPSIETDAFVVMPNHIHGIIVIDGPVGASLVDALDDVGARVTMARDTRATTRVAPTLGDVIGAYKSSTTVEYARGVGTDGWRPFNRRLWQRNYYERVIRTNEELDRIREYIVNNPAQWEMDAENPDAIIARKGWGDL